MRTLWVAVVVLTAAGCSRPELKDYQSAEGRFSARMPGEPRPDSRSAGGVPLRAVVSESHAGAAVVAWADLPVPDGETAEQSDARLEGACDGMARNVGVATADRKPVRLADRHPGREVSADLPHQKGKLRGRVYLVGKRLYQLLVLGHEAYVDHADSHAFLDSFRVSGE